MASKTRYALVQDLRAELNGKCMCACRAALLKAAAGTDGAAASPYVRQSDWSEHKTVS